MCINRINSSIYDHNYNKQRSRLGNPIGRHHFERIPPDDVHNYYNTLDYSVPMSGHHSRRRGRFVIYYQSPSYVRSDTPMVHSSRLPHNDIGDTRIVRNDYVYFPFCFVYGVLVFCMFMLFLLRYMGFIVDIKIIWVR